MEDSTNNFVTELLAASNACGAGGAEYLRQSWRSLSPRGESLVAHLVQQRIFNPNAPVLIHLASRGRVALHDAEPLFTAYGWEFISTMSQRQTRWSSTISSTVSKSSLQHTSPVAVELFGSAPSTDRTHVAMPQIGTLLGKCLLISLLGRGAAGTVYRALHQGLNISVAVKVLNENIVKNRKAYEQLRSEARVLAQLNHPNILRVLDFEDDARAPYVVMECVEGLSLADLIQQAGPLDYPRALMIVIQVAEALQAVWALGIIHRDVKPANILLTKDGTVKLADLGLAMVVDKSSPSLHGVSSGGSGIVGTAAYMAPEQFSDATTVDPRSDMYALGATFFQMVTGRLPFQATSLAAMLVSHASEIPESPDQLSPDLPAEAARVILRMLAKKPCDRYENYAALLSAFRNLSIATRARMEFTPPPVASTPSGSTGISSVKKSESSIIRTQLVRRLLGSRSPESAE